jgi:purine-binding chemotaxis protein CheW
MNKSFITITIDQYLFGIDVSFVREVNRYVDISPVSLAPDFIAGLMNLRGQIITIIDPGVRLDLGKTEIKQSSRCVVMKSGAELSHLQGNISLSETVGILVDAVGDIVIVEEDAIEPLPPNLTELDNEHIGGVVKLEKDLLLILKIDSLLKNDPKKSQQNAILKDKMN